MKLSRKAARPPESQWLARAGFVLALIATAGTALGYVEHSRDRETDDLKARMAALEARCNP